MLEEVELSDRDKTLSFSEIDTEALSARVKDSWDESTDINADLYDRIRVYEASWRDLTGGESSGPWDRSANFKSKLVLKYGKAIHARLWQMFSSPSGWFQARARQQAFQEKEASVQQFMNWLLKNYINSGQGIDDELDDFLWDMVFNGSGYCKVYWKRDEHVYKDTVTVPTVTEKIVFEAGSLTGRAESEVEVKEEEQEITDVRESPQFKRLFWEDVRITPGFTDPQTAPYVVNRVYMTDEQLKEKVRDGIFSKEAVEESIHARQNILVGDDTEEAKEDRSAIDGVDLDILRSGFHIVYEWYGKAYVKKEVDEQKEADDVESLPREVVAWRHLGSGKLLGWTYLHRVSPGGIRPIFKADYVKFPGRTHQVGVAELVYEEQRFDEAITNMRMDNGILASIPMFAYRAGGSLKPQMMRLRPGQGVPVDDVNDIRMLQFPFLQNFGYQEAALASQRSEEVLAVSEINLGRAPEKVGALRNATGSNLIASESNIQLQINFSRLARSMNHVLQFIFRLCRERMPEKLWYRITSEIGRPIFGQVNRDDLKGEYDFDISVDILSQSELERQQKATLLLQTVINPAATQTGVVTPDNIYNLYKNFLLANKVGRVDDFITKPQGYQETKLTPAERLYRLTVGMHDIPEPIESTVRLDEDHEKALAAYDAFEKSTMIGLLSEQALAALQLLKEAHQKMMMAANAGGNPNMQGMQLPREGLAPMEMGSPMQDAGMASMQGPVSGNAIGEAIGPLV